MLSLTNLNRCLSRWVLSLRERDHNREEAFRSVQTWKAAHSLTGLSESRPLCSRLVLMQCGCVAVKNCVRTGWEEPFHFLLRGFVFAQPLASGPWLGFTAVPVAVHGLCWSRPGPTYCLCGLISGLLHPHGLAQWSGFLAEPAQCHWSVHLCSQCPASCSTAVLVNEDAAHALCHPQSLAWFSVKSSPLVSPWRNWSVIMLVYCCCSFC